MPHRVSLDSSSVYLDGLPPPLVLDLAKLALTPRLELTFTVQVLCVPEHAPLQPVNVDRLPACSAEPVNARVAGVKSSR